MKRAPTSLKAIVGPVEEFERPDAVVDPDNRNVEAERVADDAPQRFGFDLLAEKGVGHAAGDPVEVQTGDPVEECVGQPLDPFGHVEPVVGAMLATTASRSETSGVRRFVL